MILTCPSCDTRYQVDETAIDRAAGRQVRCANCGYLWHFAPSLEEHLPAQPARAAAATAGRAPDPGVFETSAASALPPTLDLGSAAAPAIDRLGPGLRGLLQLAAVLIVGGAVIAMILARNTVVETFPDTAKVYEAVGLKTAGLGSGLDITVTPLRSGSSFVVTGEIANTTGKVLTVPPLRVALRDTTQKEVDFQFVDPPVETLEPGKTARFRAVFDHPSVAATDVVATFGSE